MALHALAGRPVPASMRTNIPQLLASYYTNRPRGPVAFGTSGHRGSSLNGTFNEPHVAATAQAICEFRASKGVNGPLFMGFDTHALSEPAFRTALEVFAANGVEVVIHAKDEYTPTPAVSFMILEYNKGRASGQADGVIITPSHNPPADGGFKYNPPHGGPADIEVTAWIQDRANSLMGNNNSGVKRLPYERAKAAATTSQADLITPYVAALGQVINMEVIRASGLKIGADPMGGAGVHYWPPIAEKYGLNIEVVNPDVDHTFGFMTADKDGKIRMDCSSPYAMAGLVGLKDKFDIAFGNDTDFDRHGIVTADGLMNPNHYLSVAIWYLLQQRPGWDRNMRIGKTLVSSSMIDKVVAGLAGKLYEVPVGFKWFVSGLLEGTVAFGGEESAGASLLRRNGQTWTTDKDGIILALLSAEILAKTGRTPSEIYQNTLAPQYGEPFYQRADGPITDEQKAILTALTPESLTAKTVAGLPIRSIMTVAPGNGAPIGGVKVVLENESWFAIRPSGTEPKMKVYIESFGGEELWTRIHDEAAPLIFQNAV